MNWFGFLEKMKEENMERIEMDTDVYAELKAAFDCLQPELVQMYDHERDFVEGQIERFKEYDDDMFISTKQLDWLRRLVKKYC